MKRIGFGWAVLGLVVASAFGCAAVFLPIGIVHHFHGTLTTSERASFESSTRTAIATVLVAVAGSITGIAALATYRASRVEEARRSSLALRSERAQVFSRSVGQLNQPADVRVGAVLALEQLARAGDEDAAPVYSVLHAYVTVHSAVTSQLKAGVLIASQPTDVQIALDAMRRIRSAFPDLPPVRPEEFNAKGADLTGLVDD